MSVPFYVSPEQIMKDRSDYARKGVERGRPVIVMTCADGIVFVTPNSSQALHKTSELYDRIGFAAVGKYNEFESLRVAGIRYADLRGYSYSRADVTARALANTYAQTLGSVFTVESKPLEVELVVAEVGSSPDEDELYRLSFDGSVAQEQHFVVMGNQAEELTHRLSAKWEAALSFEEAVAVATDVLSASDSSISLTPQVLEVAVLDRNAPGRAFTRWSYASIAGALEANGDSTT